MFPEVSTIPGDRATFSPANRQAQLTDQPDELLRRLKSRHLETSYVREYYLPFRMSPDRMSQLAEQIRPRPETPVNHDFAPIAYYFDVALWSTQFNERYREAFANMARIKYRWIVFGLSALLVGGIVLTFVGRRRRFQHASVAACVGAMGFTLMALEVLLLLGFQAIYGYVYQQLALLVAAVMMGMALGSWLGLRRIRRVEGGVRPVTLQSWRRFKCWRPCLRCCCTVSSCCAREAAARLDSFWWATFYSQRWRCCCGMLGGYQFPLASSLFFAGRKDTPQNTGTLYAVDLLGACIGAIVLSAYLVPVFGFLKTAMLILVLNLATALLAFTAALREERLPA